MKKIFSILLTLTLGVATIWAETYTVSDYNYKGTAIEYVNNFNTLHGAYVTMGASANAGIKEEGYIRPSGSSSGLQTGYILLTAANNTYVNKFDAILGGSNHQGSPVALRWNAAPKGTSGFLSAGWTSGEYDYITEGADKSVEKLSYNEKELYVYTGSTKTTLGKSNYAHLQDVSVTIWVPEVVSDGTQTAPTIYDVAEKPMQKNASITFDIVYDVKHAVKKEDFSAQIINFTGKGTLVSEIVSLEIGNNAESKKLKVRCTYTTANEDDFATDYSADLKISSVNTINTNTFTTHITGAAGNIKAANTLAWNISAPYYVNTTINEPTTSNSPVKVEYSSTNPSVAEFTSDGKLILKSVGSATLSASQISNNDFKESNCPDITIEVVKRTATFTINPIGDLYTSLVYSNYITPANDPNGTMNPEYVSLDDLLFEVDEIGNLTTHAGLGSATLQAIVTSSDEWYGGIYEFPINVVRDPIHVPLCLSEDLLNNDRFFVEKTGAGAVSWENGALKMGGSHSSATIEVAVVFHITGTPDKLNIGDITKVGTINSIVISESNDNVEWHTVANLTAVASNLSYDLKQTTKYIKIDFTGVQTISISDICITEAVAVELVPDHIELYSVNGTIHNATFVADVSNHTNLNLVLSSDEFELVRDGQVFDATTNTLPLNYKDGLGVDKYASVPVQVAYVGDPATAVGKTCTVTAQDEAGNALATASIEVKEISSTGNVPNVIVEAIADATGIYTGTEHEGETHPKNGTFPYKTKWQVDVSSAFSNGQPLFDRLYILGLTTNKESATLTASGVKYHNITAPSASAPSTAVTPCYIYDKSGSGYTLVQTIDNMNPTSGTKPIGSTTANGQKYYYTGYCPYASNGFAGDKGVFYFSGGAGASVDVYLENLYMYARYHTESGATKILATDTLYLSLSLTGAAYVEASAAVFVFEPTSSTSFNPNIHLRGSNKMEGGTGALEASLAGKTAAAGMHSAPIHLIASSDDVAATLSIDDKWPVDNIGTTERTNGKLDLSPTYTGRPCIELGNDNSVLNINGGQLYLKNSVPTSSSYLCTFAIGQRSYTKSVSIVSATLKGLGTDQGGGSVNFNDGSIYCYELTDKQMETYGGYYRGKAALKCPANTKINGGTFYCDVWACSEAANLGASPTDRYGNPLASLQFPINNTPVEPYYLATVDFDNLAAHLICDDATHSDYGKSLAQYYVGKTQYGHSSLKASAENKVTFMLPYQFTGKGFEVEETVVNWVMSMSTLEAKATVNGISQNQQFGGPAEVVSGETEHTRFLLYGEIDSYTIAAAGDGSGYMTPEIDNLGTVEVTINENEYRNDITNTAAYQVDEAQFMVKPIYNADEWMLFCPPFDITNVYVVEAYPEEELKTIAETNMDEAYRLQATAAVDLFFYLGYDIGFNQTNSDFWTIYNKWKNNKELTTGAGRIKLTHFTGSNYSANYYLQRSSGIWEWDGSKFTTDWKYLPASPEKVMHGEDEYEVVMKKGEIHSMKFPYMYSGYEEWDYWTGKYLIFEGKGPQIIEGKDYHNSTVLRAKEAGAGTAEIRGNSTLAAMNVSNMGAYYLFDGAQKFTRKQNDAQAEEHWPGEGFVLATPPTSSPAPRRIASIDLMSGDVTYEPGDGSENTVTGTPTIAGEREMLVYTVAGGLGVIPVQPQHVSIYNTSGQLVASQYLTSEMQFALPAGIYLVRGEKEQAKAIVR